MFATPLIQFGYRRLLKPVLFRRDPEDVHDGFTALGERLGRIAVLRTLTDAMLAYRNPMLVQNVRGVRFPNPVGLAAGFDKDAHLTRILPAVGFGYEEIGSVTAEPCAGNPKPRLWRLPASQGLVVHYGLKNDGATVIAERLRSKPFAIPVGVSIAKTNSPKTADTDAGIADYVAGIRAMRGIGSYITINISCPNAYGGEPFTDPARLERLLAALDPDVGTVPVFLKMPVDLSLDGMDGLMAVAAAHRVDGLIISNLTKRRDRPEVRTEDHAERTRGGISGRPVFRAANDALAHAYRVHGSRFVLVGCGGIFSAEDAYEKIRLGATLVQLITGMIFEGPQLIGDINRGLVRLLTRDGFKHISEAIGSAHTDTQRPT